MSRPMRFDELQRVLRRAQPGQRLSFVDPAVGWSALVRVGHDRAVTQVRNSQGVLTLTGSHDSALSTAIVLVAVGCTQQAEQPCN